MSSNFTSYFETGYMIRGEGHKDFQTNYLTTYCRAADSVVQDNDGNVVVDSSGDTVTDSTSGGCLVRGKWDWARNILSNKWTSQQQIYNTTDRPYREVQRRKLKIRGNGSALNLRFESQDGKPFHVIGWSTYDTVKANV